VGVCVGGGVCTHGPRPTNDRCNPFAPCTTTRFPEAIEPLMLGVVQVENPIPFAEPLAARLTTGYLHARYARLLVLPLQLSADWSYPCIPYVERYGLCSRGSGFKPLRCHYAQPGAASFFWGVMAMHMMQIGSSP
jgi:hypothetical protein